jgi:hypothetical protein
MNCPLCDRPLGTVSVDEHHLIPKTFGGKAKEPIHKICHRKLHTVFTEREMLNTYHTWAVIREHEEIKTFIAWVAKKDPAFYISSKDTTARKAKRRR